MRFLLTGMLLALLASGAMLSVAQTSTPGAPTQAKDQYFTGRVMAIAETTLTVNRRVLGKDSSTKTFLITSETRFEGGRPQVGAQVTVRYVAADGGDRAIRVIVRRSPK